MQINLLLSDAVVITEKVENHNV